LEIEALAHSHAIQKATKVDDQMGDTHSNMHTSTYDTGDENEAVRFRAARPSSAGRSHSMSHFRCHFMISLLNQK
jgi:hypothetical protein